MIPFIIHKFVVENLPLPLPEWLLGAYFGAGCHYIQMVGVKGSIIAMWSSSRWTPHYELDQRPLQDECYTNIVTLNDGFYLPCFLMRQQDKRFLSGEKRVILKNRKMLWSYNQINIIVRKILWQAKSQHSLKQISNKQTNKLTKTLGIVWSQRINLLLSSIELNPAWHSYHYSQGKFPYRVGFKAPS